VAAVTARVGSRTPAVGTCRTFAVPFTMRAVPPMSHGGHPDVPSLRSERFLVPIQSALRAGTTARFRVLEFSIQTDHLHLLVEANGPTGFERGVRGLAIRIARLVNRLCGRRGAVWGDRYHARLLRTPREVRNALVYVLNNFKKHLPGARGTDPYSSARWFTGWRAARAGDTSTASPVARAKTWLARVGWRKGGLIGADESPGRVRRRRERERRGTNPTGVVGPGSSPNRIGA
jgi:putative transposase